MLILTLLLECIAMGSVLADSGPTNLILGEVVQLNESYSSSVFTEAATRSARDCAMRCQMRGCAALSQNEVTGLCQLVVLNNASKAAGPPGTHVQRLVGAEPGDRVWKAADFEEQLRSKKYNAPPLMLTFNNTSSGRNGAVQSLNVTMSGCYRIEAAGARGGSTNAGISPVLAGGNGARMAGNFNLTAGTVLSVVVGQRGGDASQAAANAAAGGGGGSFLYTSANVLLLAAGGGGGGGSAGGQGIAGQNGTNGTDSLPNDSQKGFGGLNGQPGYTFTTNGNYHGGSGAGWLGKANMTQRGTAHGDRGGSRADGWIGGVAGGGNPGAIGGFGGGGGGSENNGASGGGGGFSGGGSGQYFGHTGGGGGSFCGGRGCNGSTGGNANADHGFVILTLVSSVCA